MSTLSRRIVTAIAAIALVLTGALFGGVPAIADDPAGSIGNVVTSVARVVFNSTEVEKLGSAQFGGRLIGQWIDDGEQSNPRYHIQTVASEKRTSHNCD